MNNTQLTTAATTMAISPFLTGQQFADLMEQATVYASSELVPKDFRGKPANVLIAMEMSARLGAGWFQVIQNLDIIHGRPSFRASFLMAMINASGRFGPLDYEMEVTGTEKSIVLEYDEWQGSGPSARKVAKKLNYTYTPTTCRAVAEDKRTGKIVKGPPVSYDMAIHEGWVSKAGSKWQSPMRELMLIYRAGSFFSRVHASDMTLGMQTSEELQDAPYIDVEEVRERPAQPQQTTANPYKPAEAPAAEATASEPAKPARRTRTAAATTEAPAADPAPATKPEATAPSEERGKLVFYEKTELHHGESSKGPWTKYTVHYFIPGGGAEKATTFSDTIVAPLNNADEGLQIRIETTPNPKPNYAPTLTYLKVVDDGAAPEKTQPSDNDGGEGSGPWA